MKENIAIGNNRTETNHTPSENEALQIKKEN